MAVSADLTLVGKDAVRTWEIIEANFSIELKRFSEAGAVLAVFGLRKRALHIVGDGQS
jgi:hypothetical protein